MERNAIEIDPATGKAVIHHTVLFKLYGRWADEGSLEKAFVASVKYLADAQKLDLSVLHGEGSNTAAKKGRWTRLQWPQTSERRKSDRDFRQPRLRPLALNLRARQSQR